MSGALTLRQTLRPEQGTSLARSAALVVVTWLSARHIIPAEVAMPLTLLGVQLWSAGEKVIIRSHAAPKSAPIIYRPNIIIPQKVFRPMDIFAHLDALPGKVSAFVNQYGPEAFASLPPDFANNLTNLVGDAANAAKGAAQAAITEAEAKLPPEAAEFGPLIANVLGGEIDKTKAEADAKIARLQAAAAALQPAV